MTLSQRLKQLRLDAGHTQESMGAFGFVSAPGWIKIENGQRSPSEKLVDAFLNLLVQEKQLPAKNRAPLREELLTLKYLSESKRPFLAQLARAYAASTPWGNQLLVAFEGARNVKVAAKRGRPKGRIVAR